MGQTATTQHVGTTLRAASIFSFTSEQESEEAISANVQLFHCITFVYPKEAESPVLCAYRKHIYCSHEQRSSVISEPVCLCVCERIYPRVLWRLQMNTKTIYTATLLYDIVYDFYFSYRNMCLWFVDAGTERTTHPCRGWTSSSCLTLHKIVLNEDLLCWTATSPSEGGFLHGQTATVWILQLAQVSQDAVNDTTTISLGWAVRCIVLWDNRNLSYCLNHWRVPFNISECIRTLWANQLSLLNVNKHVT